MWILFLSTKDQTKIAMNLFKAMVEIKFGCEIKSVQSDGRGELNFLSYE